MLIPATGLPRPSERNHIQFCRLLVLSCLPIISDPVSSAFTETLGLELQYGVRERGAVGPASPSGHYVEAPAAALFPAPHTTRIPEIPLGGRYADFSNERTQGKKRFVFAAFPGFGSTLSGVSAGWQNLPRSKDSVFRPSVLNHSPIRAP
ncbi:hypothetical protein NXC14_PA00509 (plasmid) [Rhizobium sp. NXC14]|nr:hypothetical protein NXC14_PA00509 [Rhizobium sp. NXC14]